MLLVGHKPELSDAERIDHRQLVGDSCRGPAEWDPCNRHEGHGSVYRWVWEDPEDGDHVTAIECASEPVIVATCPMCAAEDEAQYQDDCA
jgi:hypothetical protein